MGWAYIYSWKPQHSAKLPMAISALMAIEDELDDSTLVSNVISEAREGARQVELAFDDDEDEEDL